MSRAVKRANPHMWLNRRCIRVAYLKLQVHMLRCGWKFSQCFRELFNAFSISDTPNLKFRCLLIKWAYPSLDVWRRMTNWARSRKVRSRLSCWAITRIRPTQMNCFIPRSMYVEILCSHCAGDLNATNISSRIASTHWWVSHNLVEKVQDVA